MAESDFAPIDLSHAAGHDRDADRAVWSTPLVIASDLRAAKAHVGAGADGSSPGYGSYGS